MLEVRRNSLTQNVLHVHAACQYRRGVRRGLHRSRSARASVPGTRRDGLSRRILIAAGIDINPVAGNGCRDFAEECGFIASAYRGFRVVPDLLWVHCVIVVSSGRDTGNLSVWPATYGGAVSVVRTGASYRSPGQTDRTTASPSRAVA